MIADVLVELKLGTDQTFSYLVPRDMKLEVGERVLVPFGKQVLEGFVMKLKPYEKTEYELKEIIEQIDEKRILSDELIDIGNYISKKTLSNTISAYQTMLPSALKAKANFKIPKKYKTYIELNIPYDEAIKKVNREQQLKIIEKLRNGKILKEESLSSLTTLIKNKIVKETKEEEYRINKQVTKKDKITLTDEQQKAVDEVLKANEFKPFLLFGVTGSGKTEVYMNLIEEKIRQGLKAIVLVPEISLTPQVLEKFYNRFGNGIAILHSGLSNGEKYDEWRKIERGEVNIVIGARSAIFAPIDNLGIIIVDEEHSTTYKQENNPKYNAIDIALYRAKKHNIPVVLGSATPQIESFTKAKLGQYKLIELKTRVNVKMPKITLVDMKEEIKNGNPILSQILKDKLNEVIKNDKQAIILLNKRGYTRILTCPSCGYQEKCKACDIPLTYHKSSNMMRCHYCGYGKPRITTCPVCGNKEFKDLGMGTEKLEEYIINNIESAKVIRMDVDTTTKKGAHEKIIRDFQEKKANILVGTQMISKGLDFKDVTLVGVLSGDSSLNIPDFRSAERTYQLLSQVAGRSGRSSDGEVIIQGFNMEHYSIIYAKENDYESFYNEEMKIRKVLKYSPYYNLSTIKLKGKDINELFNEGYKIVEYLKSKKLKDTYILGPSTSMIPKINNIFSVQILLKYKDTKQIYPYLKELKEKYQKDKILLDIDMSPIQM